MKIFDNIKRQFDNFDFNKVIDSSVMLDKNKDAMIEFNQAQLYIDGVTSDGNKIKTYAAVSPNSYAQSTIKKKKREGAPYNHVTLFDKGDFYKTFDVKQLEDHYLIFGDAKKPDGLISDNVNLSNVFGLIDENKDKFIEINIKKTIFGFVNNFVKSLKI